MKPVLPLFIFIDACGWEIIRNDPFGRNFAPHRRRLDSVFGYSSACVPSILSGAWPESHRHWCYFVHDPEHSPFKFLKPLQWLPKAITNRRRFRRWLSLLLKGPMRFKGYFDLYNIPFRHISRFDFTEKRNPLEPGGMNRGENIFDYLSRGSIPYHVSRPAAGEEANLEALSRDIATESIDFAFLYWPELDGLLHRVGNQAPEISPKLREYERRIEQLMALAREHYEEVRLYVFSDHGMANCDRHIDIMSQIESLDLKFGEDYVAVYDSTMARFWFLKDGAREVIREKLGTIPEGRILKQEELADMGADFGDDYFGELFFLMEEGVLIVPSHMSTKGLKGMHGFHPDAIHSYASLLSNVEDVPQDVTAIPHIFKLMKQDATDAHNANTQRKPRVVAREPAVAAAVT